MLAYQSLAPHLNSLLFVEEGEGDWRSIPHLLQEAGSVDGTGIYTRGGPWNNNQSMREMRGINSGTRAKKMEKGESKCIAVLVHNLQLTSFQPH